MSTALALFVLMVVLVATVLLYTYRHSLGTISRVAHASKGYTSFRSWSRMICGLDYIQVVGNQDIQRPSVPHFILSNHISSHLYIGSYLTISNAVGDGDCVAVAYRNYTLWGMGSMIEDVLGMDIRVDRRWKNHEKEQYMVREIRSALERGQNVVMFVDAHACKTKPMRSLNRAVLAHFPETEKVFVHLREPTTNMVDGTAVFSYQVYPHTKDLEKIVHIREKTM